MTAPYAAPTTLDQRLDQREGHWLRYLADLQTYAAIAQPLQAEGTLLRVTGLVL